jgi:hypothetical protein
MRRVLIDALRKGVLRDNRAYYHVQYSGASMNLTINCVDSVKRDRKSRSEPDKNR